jgi:hypothetical protein
MFFFQANYSQIFTFKKLQLQVKMKKKGQMMKVHQKAFSDGWGGPKGSFWLIFC